MSDAHVRALAKLDLNVLLALDALLDLQSVTRAAEHTGVTQSAMSHTLRRLRELFDDPLLVRGRGGMMPTPRAERLQQPVRSALVALHRAIADPDPFDPTTSDRTFRFAAPDAFAVLFVPPLLGYMATAAPRIDLVVERVEPERIALKLETGDLDAIVLPSAPEIGASQQPPGWMRRRLLRDGWTCVLRRDHPALEVGDKGLDLEAYATLPHALMSPQGGGQSPVDRLLAEAGLKRRIALRLPSFYAASAIIAQSHRLVLTAPAALGEWLARDNPVLTVVPVPLPLPELDIHLVWHQRFSDDPGHAWFRGTMQRACAGEL